MADLREARLALIPTMAAESRSGHIGRTALVKYMYFLQTLRGVPLGYRFSLYSYGPFDSEVLADLASAETLSAVQSEPVLYSGGYGYEIRPGTRSEWITKRASDFLSLHKKDVDWVLEKFGMFNSTELEIVSTVVYVDREAVQGKERIKLKELASRVHEVKPHFSEAQILTYAQNLAADKLLKAAE